MTPAHFIDIEKTIISYLRTAKSNIKIAVY